ncbi:MAG: ATP-dependent RNA helicase HrpA [Actinomycetia bacterium]|nr:ATP-dependent RNA helicase HrpA [Actinomycetes bacterium]
MTSSPSLDALRQRVDKLPATEQRPFRKRLRGVEKVDQPDRQARILSMIARDLDELENDDPGGIDKKAQARRSNQLNITYPAELPITERRQELLHTIGDHQVVIVAGETGSGKSTQLPKLCLELGRGVDGVIGHTQPRRIAARSIAERVAEELGGKGRPEADVGGVVGYQVRFTDEVSDRTMVKLMTDGILLAEIQRDRQLSRYDTIIIDEAHERSLNIDFLMGWLHQLLPQRPDLKVIVTSATIDTEKFARHFGPAIGLEAAPIVEVSGRTYPVEVRYQPLDPADANQPGPARDQDEAICDAVTELFTEGMGDVLVFCSGEREIRDAVDALTELELPNTEILPLFGRLSAAEQHRVFAGHKGRRVVVATNVAETSITVPGIRYVVDPGAARISRFNRRTKVQRLPIEPVSRASANQRAGRCGRLGPGVAVRLYTEDDFDSRDEFTEPEIRRTNLASVILQMAALGLGDVEAFPFVDPPDKRAISDGVALLEELGAVEPDRQGTRQWITPLGRQLAKLPVDPRMARMLVEANRLACLHEVLIIVAGLSIQDPRERPSGKEQQAAQLHARFTDDDSDFIGWLNLWEYLRNERRARSSNQFRRLVRDEHLHYLRVREWQDVHGQLRQVCRELGLSENAQAAQPDAIHQALLAGLLSHVGLKDPSGFEYRGARGARFAIAPGSVFFKRSPRWAMAAELVETNRLWARGITRVKPEWIERSGAHLVKHSYGEAWWSSDQGAALVHESVTLYGLPLATNRTVQLGRVDPELARWLFIVEALVDGDWETHHRFVAENRERIEEAKDLEARFRRGDLLIGHETLIDWFDRRLPDDITTTRHFDKWWNRVRRETPDLLSLTLDDLIVAADDIDHDGFPEVWHHGDLELPITYQFDPGGETDGLTIDIPVEALTRLDGATFAWLVPGLRAELVTHLIRSLPKPLRRNLVPVPATVEALLPRLDPTQGDLIDVLRRELGRVGGEPIPPGALSLDTLPAHLRPRYDIIGHAEGGAGVAIAEGTSLTALADLLDREVRSSLAEDGHPLEQEGLTTWSLGELPRTVETVGVGHTVTSYPSLIDEGSSVAVRILPTADEQADGMWGGTRRLLLLNRPSLSKVLRPLLTNDVKLALVTSPYESPSAWFDDCLGAAIDGLLIDAGGPVWTATAFDALLDRARRQLPERVEQVARQSVEVLRELKTVDSRLDQLPVERFGVAIQDGRGQLARLIYPGFLTGMGSDRLADLARYLRALAHRLDRLPETPDRDRSAMARVRVLEAEFDRLAGALPPSAAVEEVSWMLQEYRVSQFAQHLGTRGSVSEKRIRRALAAL